MSAESGLQTFRGAGGLWEGHPVEAVATPEAWDRDPALVLRFYNERRRQLRQVKPNAGHLALAALEANYDVHVVTQNVDDLHERGGSTRVLHLHGQLMQARSTVDEACITELKGRDIELGDRCVRGGSCVRILSGLARLCLRLSERSKLCAAQIFCLLSAPHCRFIPRRP